MEYGFKANDGTRIEVWNGSIIRFVEDDAGEIGRWSGAKPPLDLQMWAVMSDVAKALGYKNSVQLLKKVPEGWKCKNLMWTHTGRNKDGSRALQARSVNVITEGAVHALMLQSKKPEAIAMREWVASIHRELWASVGLPAQEGLMSRKEEREALNKLRGPSEAVDKWAKQVVDAESSYEYRCRDSLSEYDEAKKALMKKQGLTCCVHRAEEPDPVEKVAKERVVCDRDMEVPKPAKKKSDKERIAEWDVVLPDYPLPTFEEIMRGRGMSEEEIAFRVERAVSARQL